MDEREFLTVADAELARLEAALGNLADNAGADIDFELKPGGIIELVFEDGSKIIVNRHAAAREIWVAARSGGFHFKPPALAGGPWTDTRDGESLAEVLSRCISEQAGEPLHLEW